MTNVMNINPGQQPYRLPAGAIGWPHADPDPRPLPATLPDGLPWPRITVVTPSFNQGRFIEQTILSVANQGYPDVEHIVIDGGSQDETLEVLARHQRLLAHVVSEQDEGQSDAINKGFARGTGQIFTWLNADDMFAPGALAAAALAFWRSKADMVAGVCELYRNGELVDRHLTACASGPLPLSELLDLDGRWLKGQFFFQPEVLFTRDLWERAGGHVRVDAFYSMDYELWLRFAHAGASMHVIGRPIARYRLHDDQKTAIAENYRAELPHVRDRFATEHGLEVPEPMAEGRRKLRVALFNDVGYAYGAGIAHRRIGASMLAAGHDVQVIAIDPGASTGGNVPVPPDRVLKHIEAKRPDLVVIGNIHNSKLSPEVLGLIAARFPTLFVLHDLWLVTGRCAYAGACEQFMVGCSERCTCAQVFPFLPAEQIGPAWEAKRRALSSVAGLACVGDSRYVADVLTRALDADPFVAVTQLRPEVDWIKYGLETDIFKPRDKRLCREMLGLPQDKFIIMAGACSLDDERKGISHLARALASLALPDVLVVGVGYFPPQSAAPPIPGMRAMGYMEDPAKLAALYAAADLFVGPSLEEAFGQVFIEASACGTPAIGYPVGGVPEAITHRVTGLIAERVHPDALADAIKALYEDAELRERISRTAPIHTEAEWSLAAAYHRLYRALCSTGLAQRLSLAPKIHVRSLNPAMPVPERVISAIGPWRATGGFDKWEGPYPEKGIPRCRWILGPTATCEIDSPSGGPHRLVVRYRNFEPDQVVRVVHNGQVVGEQPLPITPESQPSAFGFPIHLKPGTNQFEIHCWRWCKGPRPMSILVTDVRAVPRPSTHRQGTIEPKPGAIGIR